MATRYIQTCDICGKEIKSPYHIILEKAGTNTYMFDYFRHAYHLHDVCSSCYEKVYDYISELLDSNYEDATGR